MRAFAHAAGKLSATTYALARRKPTKLWVRLLLRNNEAIKLSGRTGAIQEL